MTLSQLLQINNQFLFAWGPPLPFPPLGGGKRERVRVDQTHRFPETVGNGGKRSVSENKKLYKTDQEK